MDCVGLIHCLYRYLSSVACCWTCTATQPEFIARMREKPSGLHLLKLSENSSHMQSVLRMEVSMVTTPLKHGHAGRETVCVCVAYILPVASDSLQTFLHASLF